MSKMANKLILPWILAISREVWVPLEVQVCMAKPAGSKQLHMLARNTQTGSPLLRFE